MNRQTKRMLQRQGQLPPGEGGEATETRRKTGPAGQQPPNRRPQVRRERTSPAEFVREVRGELRRVAWPTRGEVINYSTIVLVTLVVLITLIFVLDFVFAKSILFLFETPE